MKELVVETGFPYPDDPDSLGLLQWVAVPEGYTHFSVRYSCGKGYGPYEVGVTRRVCYLKLKKDQPQQDVIKTD
jgi:hypothetical protein